MFDWDEVIFHVPLFDLGDNRLHYKGNLREDYEMNFETEYATYGKENHSGNVLHYDLTYLKTNDVTTLTAPKHYTHVLQYVPYFYDHLIPDFY